MTATAGTRTQTDQDLTKAAAQLGTPLFYYSMTALRQQIARLRESLNGYPVRLLFATMANDRAEVLRTISGEGVGACVNSVLHLRRALDHGFPASSIQFTSCGLPVDDMKYLQSLGIPANLDSPGQIEAWCGVREGAVVGARLNAASLSGSPAKVDRIGMTVADFERAKVLAQRKGGRVNGIHIYAGTNFQTAREILSILRCAFEVAQNHRDLDYINLGGGIGINYEHSGHEFEYQEFGRGVCALARQASEQRGAPLTVLFEPGRSLVGSSGKFVTRVTDVKELGGSRFVVVDASVSVFPRPYHQPGSFHRVSVLNHSGNGSTRWVSSTIVGRTTFSRDILGSYELPADLTVGSLISFDDAGAYCESMISRFLGQGDPAFYVAEK